MGYDPNEPRDSIGRWTDSGISDAIMKKMSPGLDEEKQILGFAPFRELNIYSPEEDKQIRNSFEYQQYVQNATDLANELGVKITDTMETWGGWVDTETGKPTSEVSNIFHVQGDPAKVELMGAILGETAPETQNAVMVGHYGSPAPGTEYTIQTGSAKNGAAALEYLGKNKLLYYSMDKNTGDVIILDPSNDDTEKIINFANDLKKNNLYKNAAAADVQTRFIEASEYRPIIERSRNSEGGKNGFDADAFIKKARGRLKEAAQTSDVVRHGSMENWND